MLTEIIEINDSVGSSLILSDQSIEVQSSFYVDARILGI